MSITDAFFAFNFETQDETSRPSFPDWLSRLAFQLINNDFDQISLTSPSSRRSNAAALPVAVESHEQHSLHNLILLSPFTDQKNPRRQCSVKGCTRKTELYCASCSKIDHANGHRLFFCCGAGQRVTVNRLQNGHATKTTITTPLCYKWHLDHCNDAASSSGDEEH
jgi:hypothetical protein